eukprot:scaffold349_cov352-Prasinococcus_capsulatus_cf.AAC.9
MAMPSVHDCQPVVRNVLAAYLTLESLHTCVVRRVRRWRSASGSQALAATLAAARAWTAMT